MVVAGVLGRVEALEEMVAGVVEGARTPDAVGRGVRVGGGGTRPDVPGVLWFASDDLLVNLADCKDSIFCDNRVRMGYEGVDTM